VAQASSAQYKEHTVTTITQENTMGKLDGKVALVTGGGSGIGRASAILFAKEGSRVSVVDVSETRARDVAGEIERQGGSAIALVADVSKAGDAQRMVNDTIKHFGRLDVLYNNAGVTSTAMLHELGEDQWDKVVDICLKGVYLGCKYALPELMKHGGVIVNTASHAGTEAIPLSAHYCAAKAGVINLTRCIAMDYAPYKIRANCVCPGGTRTNIMESYFANMTAEQREAAQETGRAMHLLDRLAEPEEMARVALFLACDDSSFVTGHALVADGGITAGHRFG
jgi:meso-butanediol dehydrogenase / (S,S)-butanediol dehydrogenase / diacetyl reductase